MASAFWVRWMACTVSAANHSDTSNCGNCMWKVADSINYKHIIHFFSMCNKYASFAQKTTISL